MVRDVAELLSVTALKGVKAELSLLQAEHRSMHTHKKIRTHELKADGGKFSNENCRSNA